jgi:hypothetical protein
MPRLYTTLSRITPECTRVNQGTPRERLCWEGPSPGGWQAAFAERYLSQNRPPPHARDSPSPPPVGDALNEAQALGAGLDNSQVNEEVLASVAGAAVAGAAVGAAAVGAAAGTDNANAEGQVNQEVLASVAAAAAAAAAAAGKDNDDTGAEEEDSNKAGCGRLSRPSSRPESANSMHSAHSAHSSHSHHHQHHQREPRTVLVNRAGGRCHSIMPAAP